MVYFECSTCRTRLIRHGKPGRRFVSGLWVTAGASESHGKRSMWSAEDLAGFADRMTQLGRRLRSGQLSGRSPDGGSEHRLDTLEARIEHLDAELEGLQDAVHRRAVLEDEKIAELQRRTEPEQLACALSKDARKRGL